MLLTGVYLPSDDFRVLKWTRQADQLIKADPAEGYMGKAIVQHLMGNVDEALRLFRNALQLAPNNALLTANYCTVLQNLGYYKDAQCTYKRGGDPRSGNRQPWAISLGRDCGAIRQTAEFIAIAKTMQLDLSTFDSASIERAADIMRRQEVTDGQLALAFEVAGEILREKRLFPLPVQICTWDEADECSFSLSMPVAVDAYTAEDLDTELADRMIERGIDLPWFVSLTLVSALEAENERYPARFTESRP